VDAQTEMAFSHPVWSAIFRNARDELESILAEDPDALEIRGAVGEMPVHMCCIFGHTDLAKWIIQNYPEQAEAQYEGPEYHGENCLHIAIVNRNYELVHFLATLPCWDKLLTDSADGNFFSLDGSLGGSSRHTPCYYGELPLLFAASTNQLHLLDYLLAHGADFTATDSNGNNILHLCVVHERKEIYDRALALWDERQQEATEAEATASVRKMWSLTNHEGKTPLVLAASLGKREMFLHCLECTCTVQWAYGPVTCKIYPLSGLDTPAAAEMVHFHFI